MKIQVLAIIFIIIVLPITIIIGEYASTQIEIFKLEQAYDSRLITATHDALKAFQINTFNDATSDIADSKISTIEASVNAFYNALESSFGLEGYSKENLQMYVPALVYTMYDGYYIYSPYRNIADLSSEDGSIKLDLEDGEIDYGFKPYVYYSCRYVKGDIDVIINYSLDNYITVQGTIDGESVYKSGYLLTVADSQNDEGVYYNSAEKKYYYCGIPILVESYLTDYLLDRDSNGDVVSRQYKYVKLNGTKYYLNDKDDDGDGVIDEYIFYIMGGSRIKQVTKLTNEEVYNKYLNQIQINSSAVSYYSSAYEFSKWIYDKLGALTPAHAQIDDDKSSVKNSGTGPLFVNSQIEYAGSNFNLHKKEVIRHSIESNLSVAIANFNSYSSSTNDFQMPKLKENEWELLENEISIISFLQGLNLGGKIYNGYTVVTNDKTEEVVKEEKIYINVDENGDGQADYYHKINDKHFTEEFTAELADDDILEGVLDSDFEVRKDGATGHTYIRKKELACYTSIVGQENLNNRYDSIYEYLQTFDDSDAVLKKTKQIYYTALGRERWGTYKIENPSSVSTVLDNMTPLKNYEIVKNGLIRFYDASNIDGNGNAGNSTTTIWRDLSGNYNGIINGAIANTNGYIEFDGIDDWVSAGKIPTDLTEITLESTMMIEQLPVENDDGYYDQIISNTQGGGIALYMRASSTGNGARFAIQIRNENGERKTVESSKLMQIGKVYNISATYDGNIVRLYINGILDKEEAYICTMADPDYNTVMGIGANTNGNTSEYGYSKMKLYSARIYDKALTEDEIQQNYKAITGKTPVEEPEYYAPTILINNLSISPNKYISNLQKPILSAEITVNSGGTPIDNVQYIITQSTTPPTAEAWVTMNGAISADGTLANTTVSKQVTTAGIWYLHVKASSGTAVKTGYSIFEGIIEDNTAPEITISDSADNVTDKQYEIPLDATSVTIAKLISATDDGSGLESLITMYSTSSSIPTNIDTNGHKAIASTVESKTIEESGIWYLHVKAIDNAGNVSTETVEYTVTKQEEQVTYSIDIVNTDGNETGVYNISKNSSVSFKKQISVNSSNGNTENLTIKYSFVKGSASSQGTPIWTTYTTGSTITRTISYANYGYYYLHIKVLDASGNEVATSVQQYIFNGSLAIL